MSYRTRMLVRILVGSALALVFGCGRPTRQTGLNREENLSEDLQLARSLADEREPIRESAVNRIAAMGNAKVPLLLSWTQKPPPVPPPGILESSLDVGLAEVFGRLRTTEAIPFLIRNIGTSRLVIIGDPWARVPESIAQEYPFAGALIQIGPRASRAVITAYHQPMSPWDHVLAVFVVSQIKDVPEAKEFLRIARWQGSIELHYATEALRARGELIP